MVTYDDVIEHFGSQEKLAKALNCSRAAVSLWKGVIPDVRAYQIEVVTGGHFKADEIETRSTIEANGKAPNRKSA